MRKLTALLLALLLLPCLALAETEITISGSGTVLVPADTAVITLGVDAVNADVREAQAAVNNGIAAIRTALNGAGVADEDITTGFISIYAMYDYSDETPSVSAYNASSTLSIRVRDLSSAGTLIDLSFAAGANSLSGISFSASDTTAAESEALTAAVADARARAEIIAAAAGLRITGIEAISDGAVYSSGSGTPVFRSKSTAEEACADGAEAGTEISASSITVSANVTIVFEAEPVK